MQAFADLGLAARLEPDLDLRDAEPPLAERDDDHVARPGADHRLARNQYRLALRALLENDSGEHPRFEKRIGIGYLDPSADGPSGHAHLRQQGPYASLECALGIRLHARHDLCTGR